MTEGSQPGSLVATLRARVGEEIGRSAWTRVDQARIDLFAEATGDRQFVHVDPARAAAETPFGGTIAHGYLTLALAGALAIAAFPPDPAIAAVINLGADKVRLLAPVKAGARIRGRFTLAAVGPLPGARAALRIGAVVDIEGEPKPALTAELNLLLVLATAAQPPEKDVVPPRLLAATSLSSGAP